MPPLKAVWLNMALTRRGVRVVDGVALEKRWVMSPVSSNLTLSAIFMRSTRRGEVSEWPKERHWK